MNYVTTAAGIEKLSSNLKTTDKIYIFYKGSDVLRIDIVIGLLQIKAQKEFIRYASKEELMVNFGFLAARLGNLNVLDESLPVPDMLKDKISTKPTTRRATSSKTQTKKTVEKKPAVKTSTTKTKKEVEVKDSAEPIKRGRKKKETTDASTKEVLKPTVTKKTTASDKSVSDIQEGKSDDPVVEALKKVIPVRASDFQYSIGTNFMMGRIKLYVSETPNNEDLKRALEFNFRGDKDHIVSDAVMKNIKKVRKIVAEG